MNALIVYYSLEGNTDFVAHAINAELGAELLRLRPREDVKPSGFTRYIWGGRQVLSKAEPALQPYELDLASYTHLIIGTPVWAGSYAPAIRTFLATHAVQDKQIGLFCCYAGSEGKCLAKLREALPGNRIAAEGLALRDPLKHHPDEAAQRAAAWARRLSDA